MMIMIGPNAQTGNGIPLGFFIASFLSKVISAWVFIIIQGR